MKIGRMVAGAVATVALVGLCAPYIDADGYGQKIQDALERALNRKVKIGKVRFNLFTGPGFKVKSVTTQEAPSIGIEPFASVEPLDARVRLRSLWRRKLSFSN